MIDTAKIGQIWEYLSQAATSRAQLLPANGAFVFCRKDPLIARKAAELYHKHLVSYIMVTGGFGKDSGPLVGLQMPEAMYQAARLRWAHGVADAAILVEMNATNGGENIRLGIDQVVSNDFPHDSFIVVVHATSLRRVKAMFPIEFQKRGINAPLQSVGTN